MPIVLPHEHPDACRQVEAALETGQTIIFPTDTIYGIGGNPWDERTLQRVRTLKNRSADQPFTLHLTSVDAIQRYAHVEDRIWTVVRRLLPGPYTVLLPASPAAPSSSTLRGSVGIRVPKHPFFSRVISRLDRPLFGTSINRHGEPPLTDINEIIDRFASVDLILVGPVGGAASSIIDLTVDPPQAVRGSLPEALRSGSDP